MPMSDHVESINPRRPEPNSGQHIIFRKNESQENQSLPQMQSRKTGGNVALLFRQWSVTAQYE